MYRNMYMNTYIYIYMYIFVYTHIYIYIYTWSECVRDRKTEGEGETVCKRERACGGYVWIKLIIMYYHLRMWAGDNAYRIITFRKV